jgi:hypothetical protein
MFHVERRNPQGRERRPWASRSARGFSWRHRVVAALASGMAPSDAAHAQPRTSSGAMYLDRFGGVVRATRLESTSGAESGRDRRLVPANYRKQHTRRHAGRRHLRGHTTPLEGARVSRAALAGPVECSRCARTHRVSAGSPRPRAAHPFRLGCVGGTSPSSAPGSARQATAAARTSSRRRAYGTP